MAVRFFTHILSIQADGPPFSLSSAKPGRRLSSIKRSDGRGRTVYSGSTIVMMISSFSSNVIQSFSASSTSRDLRVKALRHQLFILFPLRLITDFLGTLRYEIHSNLAVIEDCATRPVRNGSYGHGNTWFELALWLVEREANRVFSHSGYFDLTAAASYN